MKITIGENDVGARLDKLLVDKVDGLGRAGAKRLFEEGRVRVFEAGSERGHRASKGDVVRAEGVIEVDFAEAPEGGHAAPDPTPELVILLENEHVVVVEKPAGQPSAPIEPGELGTVANALVARYPEMKGVGFSPREPGLCHRLDTNTSGILVAARSAKAFETISRALKEGRIDKRYWLLCLAENLPETGTIDIALAPHPKDRRRVYACIHPRDIARNSPKPASTKYTKVRETKKGDRSVALVEASAPKAQRHQIRAHFAAIDHPLLGDELYGGDMSFGLARHALHAHRLTFKGDAGLAAFTVESELPADLAKILADSDAIDSTS